MILKKNYFETSGRTQQAKILVNSRGFLSLNVLKYGWQLKRKIITLSGLVLNVCRETI